MHSEKRSVIGTAKVVADNEEEAYDKMPIDNFGANMLYKMGWKDNQALSKNGPVVAVDFKPRHFRLGLGAQPLDDNKKISKVSTQNEKKINYYGANVKIRKGRHKGLKGKIVDNIEEDIHRYLERNTYINIELKVNHEIVAVECDYIRLRDKHKDKSKGGSRSKSKSPEIVAPADIVKNSKKLTWVTSHILVRITDKNSKYYNTKATVDDVYDNFTFSLITKDRVMHSNFTEDSIETVMPAIGGQVIVLRGKYRGETGKLLERNKKENKIAVQLDTNFEIENYTQDDCSAVN